MDTLEAHNWTMDVSLIHIADCPNWVETGTRMRAALDNLGMDETEVTFTLLRTPEDAARVSFAGSPTILVDRTDLFPSDGRTTDLACRLYQTDGHFAALPSLQDIEDALRHHSSVSEPAA